MSIANYLGVLHNAKFDSLLPGGVICLLMITYHIREEKYKGNREEKNWNEKRPKNTKKSGDDVEIFNITIFMISERACC